MLFLDLTASDCFAWPLMHAMFEFTWTFENVYTVPSSMLRYDGKGGQDPALTCREVLEHRGLT